MENIVEICEKKMEYDTRFEMVNGQIDGHFSKVQYDFLSLYNSNTIYNAQIP